MPSGVYEQTIKPFGSHPEPALERLVARGIEVIRIPYDKVQLNGGGIHCSTCPLSRDSLD